MDLAAGNNSSPQPVSKERKLETGWQRRLARLSLAVLLFEIGTGLAVRLAPFHAAVQWGVLLHTALGVLMLAPLAWYCLRHLADYRNQAWSHITLLGWVGLIGLALACLSGVVVTVEAGCGIRTQPLWRNIHLASTLLMIAGFLPHLLAVVVKQVRVEPGPGMGGYFKEGLTVAALSIALWIVLAVAQGTPKYKNTFPSDYSYLYGGDRPFAPSLAKTDTGRAFDERSLSGSRSCGTAGCHEQITQEWLPSAHRYAAMDTVFQGIQEVMAKQNGPESTRYCGGFHDPISLFSGAKNIFASNLTGLHGYQEGVSCLSCHAIRETDVKGNANYTVTQPREYLWQWETNGLSRLARDFLIRSYPAEHDRLSKRAFKKPEYCAACHKQFIDQEVNRVGWVQLQNQYDNWAASHWNKKGDPRKTVECRECHMPLVESWDPAAGDSLDYNRSPRDHKHRSHRFVAANTVMPVALKDKLEGWKTQFDLTEKWLQGTFPVPEIAEKWAAGPIVKVAASAPASVNAGQDIPLRVIMASNKVGHDFPTGPLDIIQSWLEITVRNQQQQTVWTSGKRDEKNFLQPGTFLFKAEPVDQNGNLIDRHNLWEMVGVRFRRALFPGYSDTVNFSIPCSGAMELASTNPPVLKGVESVQVPAPPVPAPREPGVYHIIVSLQYRKIDQFLLNFLFGEKTRLTSPVTEIARDELTVKVLPRDKELTSSQSPRPAILEQGEKK